jgi:multidrug efflux pump subunit AcrA (membrane-fusion protein)
VVVVLRSDSGDAKPFSILFDCRLLEMKTIAALCSLFAVLGVTSTWLATSSDGSGATTSAENTLPVNVMTLQPCESVEREREFVGSIVAARRTRLAFERSARLIKASVDEGQYVVEGQVLAVIDQRHLNAQVTELNAGIRQQQAMLAELESGPRTETIAAASAELAALSADVELRKATLDRAQNLFQRNSTSAQALDEGRLAWKSATARREAAQRQLDELTAGTRVEQIEAQNALIQTTLAQLQRLKIDLADSELKAPFSGTIIKRFSDEGDMLNAQQPLFEILETDRLEAHVGVPSRLLESFREHDYFVLSANDLEFTGKLRAVIDQVDQATRTQTVILSIDASHPEGVADGQLVRLKFNESVNVKGFRVPDTALASGSRGLWNVYVAEHNETDGNHIVRGRVVEVLHTDGVSAIVRGAVSAGELIVADGVHRIVPGQKVVPNPVIVTAEKE